MSVLDRARSRLVFLTFLAVFCWAGALSAPTASAGPLEGVAGVTGQVTEAVGKPVQEVVETLPPPVRETVETATAPVQEVTEAPPAKEVTEAATAPVEAVTETVAPSGKSLTEAVGGTVAKAGGTVEKVGGTVEKVGGAVDKAVPSGGSTTPVTEGVNRTARETVDNGTGTVSATSKRASSSPGSDGAARTASPQDSAAPGSVTPRSGDRTARRPGNTFVPSPARNGSTAAPLPKWVAYIWPAVALARPGLAELVDRWETALRIALGTSAGSGDAAGMGPVVAGVHATGGESGAGPRAEDSSSSPLSKITSAVGKFPYNASGAALGYIAIVAIMLIALFVAVRWEIANGRREGRGQ